MKSEWAFDSLSAARWAGLRTGLGAPGAVLGASFIGYGTLARASGFVRLGEANPRVEAGAPVGVTLFSAGGAPVEGTA